MTAATTGTPSTRAASYRDDIQGMRGVAVLLVVLYHADLGFSGGYVGVDVFFTVSGFVIARMLVRELRSEQRIAFGSFYLRRARRLLPALGVLLAVTLVGSVVLAPLSGQQATARTGIGAALFNANNYLATVRDSGYFTVGADVNALIHTWSLSLEEQFYLVFPAVLAIAWRIGSRAGRNPIRLVVGTLTLMTAGSFLLALALTSGVVDPWFDGTRAAFYTAPARAWEFSVGALLAMAPAVRASPRVRHEIAAAAGLGLIFTSGLVFDDNTLFPGATALVPVVGAVLLISAGGETTVGRPLRWTPLTTVGDLSYSWYLWHWPAIVFAVALFPDVPGIRAIAALASIVPAWLSFRLVEDPIRRRPSPRTVRTIGLAFAAVVIPVLLGAGLLTASRVMVDETDLVAFADHECTLAQGGAGRSTCQWTADDATGRAVLIGDSHAWHFTEGFVGGALEVGLDATVSSLAGCPFVDLEIPVVGADPVACAAFRAEWTAALVEEPPDVVVVAASSSIYIENTSTTWARNGTPLPTSADSKADAWSDGLRRMIEPLERAGSRVVVVLPVPIVEPRFNPADQSALHLRYVNTSIRFDRADALDFRARAAAADRRGSELLATVVDPFEMVCPADPCETVRSGERIYADWSHVSVATSRSLTPLFQSALAG